MHQDSEMLLKHFFEHERRRLQRYKFTGWSTVLTMMAIAILALRETVHHELAVLSPLIGTLIVLRLVSSHAKSLKSLNERLSHFLMVIEMDWASLESMDLGDEQRDALFQAMTLQHIPFGGDIRRTRGTDEKGPAFGDNLNPFVEGAPRHDPDEHEHDYDGLEGPLKVSEELVHEANLTYALKAHTQWETAEQADMDRIESGGRRLGDLVASGWFEKNPDIGGFERLTTQHHDS